MGEEVGVGEEEVEESTCKLYSIFRDNTIS
jgi:hypothetical protein